MRLAYDPEFTAHDGGFAGAVFGTLGSLFSASDREQDLGRRALKTFQKRLAVKRAGLTYVIAVSFVRRTRTDLLKSPMRLSRRTFTTSSKQNMTLRAALQLGCRSEYESFVSRLQRPKRRLFPFQGQEQHYRHRRPSDERAAARRTQQSAFVAKAQTNEARARLTESTLSSAATMHRRSRERWLIRLTMR